jgi:hypothetical protein
MLAALLKIITTETRNGFRQIQRTVQYRPHSGGARERDAQAPDQRSETIRRALAELLPHLRELLEKSGTTAGLKVL